MHNNYYYYYCYKSCTAATLSSAAPLAHAHDISVARMASEKCDAA